MVQENVFSIVLEALSILIECHRRDSFRVIDRNLNIDPFVQGYIYTARLNLVGILVGIDIDSEGVWRVPPESKRVCQLEEMMIFATITRICRIAMLSLISYPDCHCIAKSLLLKVNVWKEQILHNFLASIDKSRD